MVRISDRSQHSALVWALPPHITLSFQDKKRQKETKKRQTRTKNKRMCTIPRTINFSAVREQSWSETFDSKNDNCRMSWTAHSTHTLVPSGYDIRRCKSVITSYTFRICLQVRTTFLSLATSRRGTLLEGCRNAGGMPGSIHYQLHRTTPLELKLNRLHIILKQTVAPMSNALVVIDYSRKGWPR